MPRKIPGKNSIGGSRPRASAEPDGRPAPYEPAPNVVALLRGAYARRAHLTAYERGVVLSLLQRVRVGHLSAPQLEFAKAIGKSVGVGFDDPPAPPAFVVTAQPWGPLPKKPPRRHA
jgi:hypothetical protein